MMAAMASAADVSHMHAALALARRGLGETAPNPSVGCVIVRDGRVVGRGVTAPGGRPHAETVALAAAGAAARGAIAYVTLEPCCHRGRTPPCTDALIEAGIARVVVACPDPDRRVDGGGVAALRAAGIVVTEGVLRDEAETVGEGFLRLQRDGRPMVTLKLATTLDGRIATRTRESQWITGPLARRAAHALRGQHDAVMVGVGTMLADDPKLTCRIPGYRATPLIRLIVDSHLRTRLTSAIVSTARELPAVFLARHGVDAIRRVALEDLGAEVIELPFSDAGVDLAAALAALGARGTTRLLVEGGAMLAASLLRADLVDRLAWFHAPSVMGGDGWPAAQAFGLAQLADIPSFTLTERTPLGDDVLSEFQRKAA